MPSFRKVKGGTGNPVLDDTIIEKICDNLRMGAYIETAVVVAGVSKVAFYAWCKLAHKGSEIHIKLLNAVAKAQEESTMRDLRNIDDCAMGAPGLKPDWTASAWRLERRRPKEWSKTERHEHSGVNGGAIEVAAETEEDKAARKIRIAEKMKKIQLLDEPE